MELEVKTKFCPKCKKYLLYTEFYKASNTKDKLRAYCKPCALHIVKDWAKKNPKLHAKRAAIYRAEKPMKVYRIGKNCNLKRTYGITIQDYEVMEVLQNKKCKICNTEVKTLFVDHCHKTKKVRALLCRFCNSLLGYARENIYILENSIKYLKEHNEIKHG